MDENYLDSLLNEVSLDKEINREIEEELDSQMTKEKRRYQEQQLLSDEDLFNMDLELDAGNLQSDGDVHFSEDQMDELDRLDNLADLDIGDMDFSDIDFDDLDVTKLGGVETNDLDDLLKEFEGDLDVANLFGSEEKGKEEQTLFAQSGELKEKSFDADNFLDSLLEDVKDSESSTMADDSAVQTDNTGDSDLDLLQALEEFGGFEDAPQQEEPVNQLSEGDHDDLDDILSMLELSDNSLGDSADMFENHERDAGGADFDEIEELPASKTDKKQQIMELIFGEQDEDDILSDEELSEIEAKRAAKQAVKKAKKEKAKAAKEEKAIKNNQKKKADNEKRKLKAEKKARLRAQELANAEPEKKLNKPAVAFIFTLFLGGTLLFFIAAGNFNYTQAIERATNYFTKQKYRKAYDEIAGVEVKEKDEKLKNRIYTVMYVERLYESYLNNTELGRQEKALDSLLRGVAKYYEHYEEAEALGVASDMDYSFGQIQTVLSEQYGITVEEATQINDLTNYDYVQYIQTVVKE